MANDIAVFFAAEPDDAAAARVVTSHLRRPWERGMRRQIADHYRISGAGRNDVAAAGMAQLSRSSTG
jgi:hypothetical protein